MNASAVVHDTSGERNSDALSPTVVSGGFRSLYVINAIAVSDSREQKLYGRVPFGPVSLCPSLTRPPRTLRAASRCPDGPP